MVGCNWVDVQGSSAGEQVLCVGSHQTDFSSVGILAVACKTYLFFFQNAPFSLRRQAWFCSEGNL